LSGSWGGGSALECAHSCRSQSLFGSCRNRIHLGGDEPRPYERARRDLIVGAGLIPARARFGCRSGFPNTLSEEFRRVAVHEACSQCGITPIQPPPPRDGAPWNTVCGTTRRFNGFSGFPFPALSRPGISCRQELPSPFCIAQTSRRDSAGDSYRSVDFWKQTHWLDTKSILNLAILYLICTEALFMAARSLWLFFQFIGSFIAKHVLTTTLAGTR